MQRQKTRPQQTSTATSTDENAKDDVIYICDDEEEEEYGEGFHDNEKEESSFMNKRLGNLPPLTLPKVVRIKTKQKRYNNQQQPKLPRRKSYKARHLLTPAEIIATASASSTEITGSAKITSVATQTPRYMMPTSRRMYDVIDPKAGGGGARGGGCATSDTGGEEESEDNYSELSLEFSKSNPPPSYHEAVAVKNKY